MSVPVITVDGPSGSGKGTLSMSLANRLSWHFLDSGAMYRVLALAAQKAGIDWADGPGLLALAYRLPVEFKEDVSLQEVSVLLDGESVTQQIRTETIGEGASQVAILPEVRQALLDRQRAFKASPGLVADGRDMGTVIFPQAELKIFLEASVEIRANRRYHQLLSRGFEPNYPDIAEEIAQRDYRDRNRTVAPLVPAADAVIVDTSDMTVQGVFEAVFGHVKAAGLA